VNTMQSCSLPECTVKGTLELGMRMFSGSFCLDENWNVTF
jgi:hypothetical protein